jgi:hypothetical protein
MEKQFIGVLLRKITICKLSALQFLLILKLLSLIEQRFAVSEIEIQKKPITSFPIEALNLLKILANSIEF